MLFPSSKTDKIRKSNVYVRVCVDNYCCYSNKRTIKVFAIFIIIRKKT